MKRHLEVKPERGVVYILRKSEFDIKGGRYQIEMGQIFGYKYLTVYTLDRWLQELHTRKRIFSKPPTVSETTSELEVKVDENEISFYIPRRFLRHIGVLLNSRVDIRYCSGYFEIWSPSSYESYYSPQRAEKARYAVAVPLRL